MKAELELKRLALIKLTLYSTMVVSAVLVLISVSAAFGYTERVASGVDTVGSLGGLIGMQLSVAILHLIRDLEGRAFKQPRNFRRQVLWGLVGALVLGVLAYLFYVNP